MLSRTGDDKRWPERVKGPRVHHHGGMHALKNAAREQQNLSASVARLFGRRPDDADGEAHVKWP